MDEPQQALPEIDFATFILSLGSSAFLHLGEVPDPDTGKPAPNLPLAKQTIDMLAMLEQKTRGNLDEAESKLLTGLLYDLRIKYVDAQKKPAK
jgi:uncharacterized protein DUF1844